MRTGMLGGVVRVGQIPALTRSGNLSKRKLPLRLRSRNIRLLAEEANKIHAFRFILHLYRRYFVIDSEFKGCVAPGGQIGKCDPALCDVIVKNCSVVVWECTLKRRIYCDITFFDEESCIDKANRAVKREQRSVWVDNSGVAVAFGRRVAELESMRRVRLAVLDRH